MAQAKKIEEAADTAVKEVCTVESLKENKKTPEAVFAGTKAMMGWRTGKQLTEKEYIKAMEDFKSSAAGRR